MTSKYPEKKKVSGKSQIFFDIFYTKLAELFVILDSIFPSLTVF